MYVFDTSPLIVMFRHYYPKRFPTLWKNFDSLIDNGHIISTRENLREIQAQTDALSTWADSHPQVFQVTDADEAEVLKHIFAIPHFRQNIEQQKLIRGGLNADPLVIAKAAVQGKIVVTGEIFKPNAAKIPNICKHFSVSCMDLEQFMEKEGWSF